ncbi:hypothetical protein K469DRAFT_747372 [Zopfia rhizophila CBS 207.26]|uniref:DUF7730 domain-containing protein n=1 Tax=Zopfia rhizophila CBS 207.26 TaxID=1314779 RepID=A0A6A6EHQ7_9PEZI|nr:hypothetical protein K469DRAFT_747372 [Zopfia rhizophila CBS 207.26]
MELPTMPTFKNNVRYFFYSHPGAKVALNLLLLPGYCICCFFCYCLNTVNNGKCGSGPRNARFRKMNKMSAIRFQRQEKKMKRRQSLSIPKSSLFKSRKIKPQQQSLMFAKLPAEIRRIIYEEVLCETGAIHVTTTEHNGIFDIVRLEYVTCKDHEKEPVWKHRECFPDIYWGMKPERRLELLKTCRFIYSEAIDVFYMGNNFIFDTMQDFILFSMSVPPKRLNMINQITISNLDYPDSIICHLGLQASVSIGEQTAQVLDIAASMSNLRSLYLNFGIDKYLVTTPPPESWPRAVDLVATMIDEREWNKKCKVWVYAGVRSKTGEPDRPVKKEWVQLPWGKEDAAGVMKENTAEV